MSARTKLNELYAWSCVLIAGAIGAACGSWSVFLIVLVLSLIGSLHSGEIRLKRRN